MFNKNPTLRSAGEKIEYTKEMLDDYIKCKEDILYFAEKYFKIKTIDKGEVFINLYPYQKKMLKAFVKPTKGRRFNIVNSSRQSGKCSHKSTNITIRNKKTGIIEDISVEKFHKRFGKNGIKEEI